MNEFTTTYRLFKEAVDYYPTDISTYEGWRELPVKLRAAGLFVQFFDQITLAYQKNKDSYPFIEEETAVSTVIQYIIKNVPMILYQAKRYTPGYMYKVAFNAIYPLGRIKQDVATYYNRESIYGKFIGERGSYEHTIDTDAENNFTYADFNFDYITTESLEDEFDRLTSEAEFFNILEQLSDKDLEMVEKLINKVKFTRNEKNLAKIQRIRELLEATYKC